MSEQEEALKIWKYLEPMIAGKVKSLTEDVVHRKNFTVTIAPNGTTLGVREPLGEATLQIPYVAALSSVAVGAVVRCEWTQSMTNLIATSLGNGK